MYSLTWLPDVLRQAGLTVTTVSGWENRGRSEAGETLGVICHHTGGRPTGNMPSLNTLIDGRPDLPGPLCQLALGRDGTYYVVAAGRANHCGKGMWQGVTTGNSNFIGIEAENAGTVADVWPALQLDAYHRGVAAILRHIGKGAEFCAGHKEYALPAGRKDDPLFDMDAFRTRVAELLAAGAPAVRPVLKVGDANPLVALIEVKLGIAAAVPFTANTEAAVRDFQQRRGLTADGIVGHDTWVALESQR